MLAHESRFAGKYASSLAKPCRDSGRGGLPLEWPKLSQSECRDRAYDAGYCQPGLQLADRQMLSFRGMKSEQSVFCLRNSVSSVQAFGNMIIPNRSKAKRFCCTDGAGMLLTKLCMPDTIKKGRKINI